MTLWALTTQTRAFLDELNDRTPVTETTVFFRPSFGRGRRSGGSGGSLPAQFGEFDGIVLTRQAIYLVEAKWSRSGEVLEDPIELRAVQVRRHEVFRAYLDGWRSEMPQDWSSFAGGLESVFLTASWGLRVAPAGSLLAGNLEFILRALVKTNVPIIDVLLLLVPPNWTKDVHAPEPFTLVKLQYIPVEGSEYVELA